MKNIHFNVSITVDSTPKKCFDSILNFRGWWSEEIEGKTDVLNETFLYHYKDLHICKLKLIESKPNKQLIYEIPPHQ